MSIASDTTNTPYNPLKNNPLKNESKRQHTSLLTSAIEDATIKIEPLSIPLVDGLAAPYPPVPPPAPRYCTRQTTKQMDSLSKELTQHELEKLQKLQSTRTGSGFGKQANGPSSFDMSSGHTDLHRIMYQYADKQQKLCTQLCDLNSKLQDRQDTIVRLKDEKYDTESQVEHYRGIADSYENDIEVLTEERDSVKQKYNFSRLEHQLTHVEYQNKLKWCPIWCFLFCFLYTVIVLHFNHRYSLDLQGQYALYANWFNANIINHVLQLCIIQDGILQ